MGLLRRDHTGTGMGSLGLLKWDRMRGLTGKGKMGQLRLLRIDHYRAGIGYWRLSKWKGVWGLKRMGGMRYMEG